MSVIVQSLVVRRRLRRHDDTYDFFFLKVVYVSNV